jgi:hypothetical protein
MSTSKPVTKSSQDTEYVRRLIANYRCAMNEMQLLGAKNAASGASLKTAMARWLRAEQSKDQRESWLPVSSGHEPNTEKL